MSKLSEETKLDVIRTKISKSLSPKVGSSYLHLLFATGATSFDYALLSIGFFAAIGAGIPFPLLGILFGQLVDDLDSSTCTATSLPDSNSQFGDSVNKKILYILYVTIANFVLIYTHTAAWSLVGERLVRRLRNQYLSALLRQELAYFDTLPAGEVASRLDADLQIIQTGTSEKVGICITSFSYFVTAYIVAFIKSPKLAGILFSLVPAYLLMAFIGGHYVQKYASKMSDHVAKATAVASGGLANMVVITAFGANERLEKVFAQHLGKARKEGLKKAFVSSVQLGLLYFVAYSANALAFWEGSREIANTVANGGVGVSVGSVYTVIFILVDASFIISQVAPFLQLFAMAAASFGKLATTLQRHSAIDGTTNGEGTVLDDVEGDIEFRNVSFCYPSRPTVTVLDNFSLRIPATKHTAIVGLSGSGKSTLAALLGRLYDPNKGTVFIDGHDMRSLNARHMRRFVGTVEQNGRLFDRSILENIAHGLVNSPAAEHTHLQNSLLGSGLADVCQAVRLGSSIEEATQTSDIHIRQIISLVQEAASLSGALSFIQNLRDGLATSVGSVGNQLSGGQKQRVVLARALIRQPRILVLDEATASLDSASERRIQAALDQATVGRTTITIAHRLSTIRNADNIVVMRDGKILEQGTYAELLAIDGAFAGMIKMQNGNTASLPLVRPREGSIGTESLESLPLKEYANMDIDDKLDRVQQLNASGSQGEPKERGAFRSIVGVMGMSRPWIAFILLGLSASAIVGGSQAGEAVIFGHTIGSLSPCRGEASILNSGNLFGLLFFILAVVEFFANIISTSAFGRVAESLLYKLRILTFRSLFHQSIAWHESEDRTPSSLLSYISSDANSMSGLTGTILGVMFAILINMLAGIILAHIIAWKIAIVLLATVPILLVSGFLRLRVAAQFHGRHQKAFANSVGIATEAVSSIKTVATFSLEAEVLQVYERSLTEPYNATLKSIAYGNLWLAMAYSISNLVYALAYWWGSKQIVEGTYTPTQFFIVLPALLFSAQSCGQMFSLAPDVSKASVSASRVLSLIKAGPDDRDTSSSDSSSSEKQAGRDLEASTSSPSFPSSDHGVSVSFNNVQFAYPARPHIQILHDLTLTIPSNTFCALVGPSGAGKSTIIALLERFYDPSSGTISINGANIARLPGNSFRDQIALVPQESVLFEGSVRFNIALGASSSAAEPSLEDVIEACKSANIHDTIVALPQGYSTECGSNGSQFSGGQLQRLSIARALIRKPKLLLLDESTSALDAESEGLVSEALGRLRDITVVAIAHRLRTIRGAGRIFLIEAGKCVDQGTHGELMDRNETYRENVAHQTLEN